MSTRDDFEKVFKIPHYATFSNENKYEANAHLQYQGQWLELDYLNNKWAGWKAAMESQAQASEPTVSKMEKVEPVGEVHEINGLLNDPNARFISFHGVEGLTLPDFSHNWTKVLAGAIEKIEKSDPVGEVHELDSGWTCYLWQIAIDVGLIKDGDFVYASPPNMQAELTSLEAKLNHATLAAEAEAKEVDERGHWNARQQGDNHVKGVFVESDDFTHDVRLYVNGDFANMEQRLAYADEIAKRLNAWNGMP
jgi:hypothetical protein